MSITVRPARKSDIPVITRIYAHAVEHGTASFELNPPDEAEMARRMQHLLADNFPYLLRRLPACFAAMPMRGFTGHGLRIGGRSKIRSISRTICTAAASATRCWLRSLKGPERLASGR